MTRRWWAGAAAISFLCWLAVGAAFAGPTMTKVTRVGRVELFDPKGVLQGQFQTLDECVAAIPLPAALGEVDWRCKAVTYIRVTPSCEPQPEPEVVDNYTILEAAPEPKLCPDGVNFEIGGRQWVDHPYPECGHMQDVVLLACGHVVPDEVEHVEGDLLMTPHPELVGTDPAPVCKTVDCNE